MSIIGINGKIGSGKDLTGKIIQALTNKPNCFSGMEVITEQDIDYKVWDNPKFKTMKFAATVKNIVCLMIGCTMEQLEDQEFKNTELEEEWWYWINSFGKRVNYLDDINYGINSPSRKLIKLTPRLMLQLVGTETGRLIIHPNVWVISLMSQYKGIHYGENLDPFASNEENMKKVTSIKYPDWVITDLRFPNEMEAIKKVNGITIKVNRQHKYGDLYHIPETVDKLFNGQHISETALDNAKFDYEIDNDGTIKNLVDKIREVVIKEKFI